ncbi:MAG: metallophosphoesterase [Deltaproteobacteria bacterium]|nr:metallophosphoesterase [Deltaproteobacteria bacterium]
MNNQTLLSLALCVCLFVTFNYPAEGQQYAILGDAGEWNTQTQSVRDSIQSSSIDRLVLLGDNYRVPFGTYEEVWAGWKGFQFPVVAIGNHTLSYSAEMKFFKMPGEYYSFKDGEVLFLVLNSDNASTAVIQAEWFDDELSHATERFIFVVFHHPPYTIHHSWTEKRAFHERIRPIIKRHRSKITALLAGHDHIASLTMLDDFPMFISGAVFEALPALPKDYIADDGTHVQSLWRYSQVPHWLRLDIKEKADTAWFNFVQANPGTVVCTVSVRAKKVLLKDNCYQPGPLS